MDQWTFIIIILGHWTGKFQAVLCHIVPVDGEKVAVFVKEEVIESRREPIVGNFHLNTA